MKFLLNVNKRRSSIMWAGTAAAGRQGQAGTNFKLLPVTQMSDCLDCHHDAVSDSELLNFNCKHQIMIAVNFCFAEVL